MFNQFFPPSLARSFSAAVKGEGDASKETPFFPQIGFCQRGDVSIREIAAFDDGGFKKKGDFYGKLRDVAAAF